MPHIGHDSRRPHEFLEIVPVGVAEDMRGQILTPGRIKGGAKYVNDGADAFVIQVHSVISDAVADKNGPLVLSSALRCKRAVVCHVVPNQLVNPGNHKDRQSSSPRYSMSLRCQMKERIAPIDVVKSDLDDLVASAACTA